MAHLSRMRKIKHCELEMPQLKIKNKHSGFSTCVKFEIGLSSFDANPYPNPDLDRHHNADPQYCRKKQTHWIPVSTVNGI